MRFVDLEEARQARGVRLAVVTGIPSPWSEAAKGILHVKGIDGLLVRFGPKDDAVKQWMGWHNAPVLFVDDDPPRTHWSDILEASERLGGLSGKVSLVPADPEERSRLFGMAHEILGEGGLVWSARLVVIHRGLTTEGREGFPLRLAQYLARKYSYQPERVAPARERVLSLLRRLEVLAEAARSRGTDYLLGDTLTALDLYAATALGTLAPLPDDQCRGLHPAMRHALESAAPDLREALPRVLIEHRDRVFARHIGLPVQL
jgi:glutathione S-transferase